MSPLQARIAQQERRGSLEYFYIVKRTKKVAALTILVGVTTFFVLLFLYTILMICHIFLCNFKINT